MTYYPAYKPLPVWQRLPLTLYDNRVPINGKPSLQHRIHWKYMGLTYKVTAFDTTELKLVECIM